MYQLTTSDSIHRLTDNAFIPKDTDNSDYVQYLTWLAAGNVPTPAPLPSVAEIVATNMDAIQTALDKMAQSRSYNDIKSACAYASTVPAVPSTDPHFAVCEKFRLEGNSLQAWMSLTWATAFAYLATVTNGTNPMPTAEQAVAMIPGFTWPD